MAARDIMPYNSPLGGHGRAHFARLNDNAMRIGEPVFIDADGDIDGAADAPTTLAGIAMAPAGSGFGFENPNTGVAYAAGDLASFVAFDDSTLFVASRFATDGAGTAATPTRANIGDLAGISLAAGNYFVDVGEANKVCIVLDVLDAKGISLQSAAAGTGSKVVVKFGAFLAGVNIQFQGIA